MNYFIIDSDAKPPRRYLGLNLSPLNPPAQKGGHGAHCPPFCAR